MEDRIKISINNEACIKNECTLGEALLLLAFSHDVNLQTCIEELVKKGYITAKREGQCIIGWRVTNNGISILNTVLLDSDKTLDKDDKYTALATSLKGIFPTGKKEGTNLYWTEGISLIIRRLKLFFKKYGNTYTEAQILEAATKYVESFNGNYQYMKLLKYFIFKEKRGVGGDIEGESELISYVENAGQENELGADWEISLK